MKSLVGPLLLMILALTFTGCGRGPSTVEDNLPTSIPTLVRGAIVDAAVQPTSTPEPTVETVAPATTAPTPTTPPLPTEEPQETATITTTTDVANTSELTDTVQVTDTLELTATSGITASAPLTSTIELTDTEELTSTETVSTTLGSGSEESGDTSNPALMSEVNVAMHDLYFGEASTNLTDPPVWAVSANGAVTLTMDNLGAVQHNWAIVKLGEEIPIPFLEEDNADLLYYNPGLQDPGTLVTTTFTAPPDAGEYTVICTTPGHYPIMQGRLEVE